MQEAQREESADVERQDRSAADAKELALAARKAFEALAASVEPTLALDLVPAVESEILARVLGLVSVMFARARGFLQEAPNSWSRWSDLDVALAQLARRGVVPFRDASSGPLFDRLVTRAIRLDDAAFATLAGRIDGAAKASLELEALGAVYEELIQLRLVRVESAFGVGASDARRKQGAHFTPRAVTEPIVVRTLAPVVGRDPLDVRVCDPAMGSAAFLVEACRYLALRLRERSPKTSETDALRRVAEKCIFGVDRDPRAVDLARLSLWLLVGSPSLSPAFADRALVRGDALVGRASLSTAASSRETETETLLRAHPDLRSVVADRRLEPLHWNIAFPSVLARGGFDAMIGNPPWVSYAGRAAQPIELPIRGYYTAAYRAFHGYRNLQALFVERAVSLLRPGGRLGFVVPTSMSDLGGYEPSRRAHDELAQCDEELPDLEDGGFLGVFQPCMALFSTRLATKREIEKASSWPLSRNDLDLPSKELLASLGKLDPMPSHLFGERGFQSTSDDVKTFTSASIPPSTTPLRVGGDVAAFRRKQPTLFCDPTRLEGRFRSGESWREVALYIRQTARWPMVTRSDGLPFRNSILAGFTDASLDAPLLVGWLNSSPIRWYHFMRHRDARQGMPQLKIAHLRALPAPPLSHPRIADLRQLGERLDQRNDGISEGEQAELDGLVMELLSLDPSARAVIEAWRASTGRNRDPLTTLG